MSALQSLWFMALIWLFFFIKLRSKYTGKTHVSSSLGGVCPFTVFRIEPRAGKKWRMVVVGISRIRAHHHQNCLLIASADSANSRGSNFLLLFSFAAVARLFPNCYCRICAYLERSSNWLRKTNGQRILTSGVISDELSIHHISDELLSL